MIMTFMTIIMMIMWMIMVMTVMMMMKMMLDFKFPNGLFWLDVRSVGQTERGRERAQVYWNWRKLELLIETLRQIQLRQLKWFMIIQVFLQLRWEKLCWAQVLCKELERCNRWMLMCFPWAKNILSQNFYCINSLYTVFWTLLYQRMPSQIIQGVCLW